MKKLLIIYCFLIVMVIVACSGPITDSDEPVQQEQTDPEQLLLPEQDNEITASLSEVDNLYVSLSVDELENELNTLVEDFSEW